jgi:hypothetical protein
LFFKEYFISIADCLDAQFRGMQRAKQNPADKGELFEVFVKNLLYDLFCDQFKIFRGGKIVDIGNNESSQMDIVLTAKNSIKIFGDKGIYPVESVFGIFSITATLDHTKLFDGKRGVIKEFKSIPKNNPQFIYNTFIEGIPGHEERMLNYWRDKIPFKCVFGFDGDISESWERELNEIVAGNKDDKHSLPDLIIVNKKGMILKLDGPTKTNKGYIIDKDFHFTRFVNYTNYGAPLIQLAATLFSLSDWQNTLITKYGEYFKKDVL